jgi:hypothetical protein
MGKNKVMNLAIIVSAVIIVDPIFGIPACNFLFHSLQEE